MTEAELQAAVRAFVRDEVAPAAAAWSMGAAPDPALLGRAGALGLMRIQVPAEAGGLGLGFAAKARAAETLARADFGFAMSVVNTQNVALRLVASAERRVWEPLLPDLLSGRSSACTALTEPGAGSDFASISTTARRDGEGWRLDGEKCWVINARHAAFAIVYAQCGEPGDRDGIGAFLVPLDRPGCSRYPLDAPFAQTSMGTGGFRLEGVRIPADHVVFAPGQAFGAILDEINGARAYVAAMCCGMLGAAIEAAGDYGESRRSFGRALAGHQAWRLALARAGVALAAARAITAEAVAAVDRGAPAQLAAAQAKIAAVDTCRRQLPELLHLMGAEGLRPQHPFSRHLAAAEIATLTDGSTEMLLERVHRLMRRAPAP
ncbi:isobutyryl-CoA dehydrogenase [Paralimibaculum aggregatum]|uniref:Isobutyryl-CoA dehydrogenase n=1 Tax=Paralimibaculum aggregatum TaxID=3036245 RepID=A0ABQ6LQQ6_9RHOB|nr:acyl-CoA dehydrogenase family protein [Limibaculum sp. NKW23]GMG83968.1 isobutyryl-CoA dehydrogenase [Limibaculum sp. NKW23]